MTMKELAKLAGVSPASVSRYLNGGSLSEEKRDVIRRAIEKTGYQPDLAAQMLRTRTTDLVGLIVPKLDSESVSRLAAGATAVLSREGYLCQFGVSTNDPEKELSYLQLFQNRSLAGIILMGTVMTPELSAFLKTAFIPLVVAGQRFEGVSCVYHDDFGAARELARLVIARGRRKLGFIGATEQDAAAGLARRRGVQAAMTEAGLAPERLEIELSGFDVEGGAAAARRLLDRAPDLDAVLCATDRMAFGAMQVLEERGRRIGEDVSLTGIGDSTAGQLVRPHLTTARFYYRTCGESAARMLLELMRANEPVPVHQTMLSYTIQQRESV